MAVTNLWEDKYTSMYGNPNQVQGLGSNYGFNTANFSGDLNSSLMRGEELAQTNLAKLKLDPKSTYYGGGGDATGLGKYMNKDFLGGIGSAMEGLGSLASGWAALKNLKLTRQAMENQQNQWQTNYEAQRLATNNAIANQNAWKQAQGRTDFGSYVGGKPAGTQYVG